MKRRDFLKNSLLASGALLISPNAYAKQYLTIEQAKKILWNNESMTKLNITLTDDQEEAIEDASDIRVISQKLNVWKTASGGWFILDQIIGKHENIDMAFAYTKNGKVKGLEVLKYRETYGHEVMNPKWRAQFYGKNKSEFLKLDKQIKNISGATLSCRHITDGINRWNHTWDLILKKH